MKFLAKLKEFFAMPKDTRGSSSLELIVITGVSIAAIIMVGLFLLTQLAVTVTPSIAQLDANSKASANTSIQSLFAMFATIVPIVITVLVVLLLAIALAVVIGAVRQGGTGGNAGGYAM